jgi:hypothetical protein
MANRYPTAARRRGEADRYPTFRLRVGPTPSNWTRPGPTWLLRGGTDSIQSRPVVPGRTSGLPERLPRGWVSAAPCPWLQHLDHPVAIGCSQSARSYQPSVSRRASRPLPQCRAAWMRLAKPVVRPRQPSGQVDARRPRGLPATMKRLKASTTKAARTRRRPGSSTPSSQEERGIIAGERTAWVGRGALGSLAGLLTLEAAADPPVREEWWMRALQFRAYGGPEVLEWAEAPDPHAGPGQIRIAVSA